MKLGGRVGRDGEEGNMIKYWGGERRKVLRPAE